jgi:ribonucleotide monophosphatase NagD (HAD superfamily)
VGHDLAFSFRKLAMATAYLTERGSVFLATNADPFDMLPLQAGGRQQRRLPAAGCMVAAVAAASSEQPLVIGKPGGAMATVLLERLGLDPLRTCIVGDRLDTDIALAASAALGGSCLCLSGCTSAEMVSEAGWPALPDAHRPAYIVERFADLVPTP